MNRAPGLVLVAALATALAAACSKPAEPPPPPRPAANAATSNRVVAAAAAFAASPSTTQVVHAQQELEAQTIEADYLAATDLRRKIALLSDLTATEPAAAMPVLGRLFHLEPDLSLKEEILHSLLDVDGAVDAKLVLLAETVEPKQPQRIRLAGIEALVDLDERRGALVVQNLVNDPDQQVREAATEALEDLLGQ